MLYYLLLISYNHPKTVISTEATDSLIVHCAVERPPHFVLAVACSRQHLAIIPPWSNKLTSTFSPAALKSSTSVSRQKSKSAPCNIKREDSKAASLKIQNRQTCVLRTAHQYHHSNCTRKATQEMVSHQKNPPDRCTEPNLERSKRRVGKTYCLLHRTTSLTPRTDITHPLKTEQLAEINFGQPFF
jgi:hypothetical protein